MLLPTHLSAWAKPKTLSLIQTSNPKWNVKLSPKLLPHANFLWNVNRYKGVCDHLKKDKRGSFGKEWKQKSGDLFSTATTLGLNFYIDLFLSSNLGCIQILEWGDWRASAGSWSDPSKVCGCWVWYLMGFCCSLSPLLLCERAGKRCPAGEQWLDWHPWRKSVWYSAAGHRSCGSRHFHGQEGHLMSGTDVTESKRSCSFEQWPGSKQKKHTQRRVKQLNLFLVYNPLAPAVSSVMI